MAGKVTFKHRDDAGKSVGWQHFNAGKGWVSPIEITEAVKAELAGALGKDLTPKQLGFLAVECGAIKTLARKLMPEATMQDIKRTLDAMAKLPPEAAAIAYRECDDSTQAEIDGALAELDCVAFPYPYPPPDLIPQAAAVARGSLTTSEGGKPGEVHRIVRLALNSWKAFGGVNMKAWHSDPEIMSPLMRWTAALYTAVKSDPPDLKHPDLKHLKELLNEMLR